MLTLRVLHLQVYEAVMRWLKETGQEDEHSAQVVMHIRFKQSIPTPGPP